jgi:hypothetical protein
MEKLIFKTGKMKYGKLLFVSILFISTYLPAQVFTNSPLKATVNPDPNFHIYICFGQSNMEGEAAIADSDRIGVNSRFKVMTVSADDYSHLGRAVGNWYTATPPLCRWDKGLTPADYFGRTLVDSLPDSIKIGVIVVAIGSSGIDCWDKDNYVQYYATAPSWLQGVMNIYGGNPYAKIIEMAKKAQQQGVIKGILLHQGEANNGEADWPTKVQKIYNNILADLSIKPDSIPLLAGEMLQKDQGGQCYAMNSIIANLPFYIPNSYVISSAGLPGNTDGFHFTTLGARQLGKRYGLQMYSLLKTYNTVDGQTVDHLKIDSSNFVLLTGTTTRIPISAIYADGHVQDINFRATYVSSNPQAVRITNGYIEALSDGSATITASFKGALGVQKQVIFTVNATSFPLTDNLFNPSISATGTFDASTGTLKTGLNGFGGWHYNNGLDISGYKYLVVKLKSASSGTSFKIFDENNYSSTATHYNFGSATQIIVNTANMKKDNSTTPSNPSHIYYVGFWSLVSANIYIKDVYLTNNSDYSKLTAVEEVHSTEDPILDVYSIMGIKIYRNVRRSEIIKQGSNLRYGW